MDITGIGAVADFATTIVNKIFPDKSEQERQQLAAMLTIIQGQIDANKIEASSNSLFVAGWRPFIGWVCGLACAWNWIGLSVTKVAAPLLHLPPVTLSAADLTDMWPLLLGMLGLGAMRSVEKIKGIDAGH